MAHVELIDPSEKLAPPLGPGYLPPNVAASIDVLLADLRRTDGGRGDLGFTVWKVKRTSVAWNHSAPINERRLRIYGARIACSILGGHRFWWFVAVPIEQATRLLLKRRSALLGTDPAVAGHQA